MHHADREERLHRAKAIGGIAYRIARAANLMGVREIEGAQKHLREFRGGLLFIDLYEPSRLPVDAEFSRLRLSHNGKKVFEIRWDGPNSLNIPLRGSCRVGSAHSLALQIRLTQRQRDRRVSWPQRSRTPYANHVTWNAWRFDKTAATIRHAPFLAARSSRFPVPWVKSPPLPPSSRLHTVLL